LGSPGNLPRYSVGETDNPAKVVPPMLKNAKRIWIVRWFISDHDAWFQQKVLPFITAANFELAGYKDFPSSEQSTTDIRLFVRR
jgi:hypothetical protein